MALAAALGVWGLHAVVGMVVLGAVAAARVPRPLALIPGWMVLVWLPGVIPILGVPWPGPELALVEWPRFATLLPLLGGAGVGALLAGAAVALLALGRVGVGAALLVPFLWGLVEVRGEAGVPGSGAGERDGGGPRVALVEMAFPPSVVRDPGEREARILEAMARLSHDDSDAEVGAGDPRAAPLPEAWPEAPVPPSTATNGGGRHPEDRYLPALQARVDSRRISLVTGSHVVREGQRRNGVLRLEVGEEVLPVHEKRRLVPGVERTAILGPGRPGRGLAPGDRRPPFLWVGRSVGALICFEILFPAEVARLRREGALLLLQLSNDSALRPDAGPFPVFLDAGRRQHEAFLRARATEFALPALRSVMGGRSGGWDARGRALPELQRWGDAELAFVVVRVPGTGPIPPAAWLSPLSGPVAATVLFLAFFLFRPPTGTQGATLGARGGTLKPIPGPSIFSRL
jgi:apolipoprotein N-acyltransferase